MLLPSLCLAPNPPYLKSHTGYQGCARLNGAEYLPGGGILDHSYNQNAPCAL